MNAAPAPSQSLIDIRAKLAAAREGLKDSVPAPSGRNISTKGKVFTMPDGKTTQGPITAVILDHRNFNKYFDKPFNAQKPSPPACFALSASLEMRPHAEAASPQSDTCGPCTFNQWGSAPAGGKGKACRNTIRLAIAAPDMTGDSEPLLINVSPTAIKHFAALVNGLDARGLLPIQVVTEISFDANQAYPLLLFKPTDALPEEQVVTMWALREKAQALLNSTPSAASASE